MPLNPVNAINFIQDVKKAKQLYDIARQAQNAYETYQKYKWAIDAARKLYKIYGHIVPAEERHLHSQPWVTWDVWDQTWGRKQARERAIKAKWKEKFLPPKGKPLMMGDGPNLGRRR